jgi:hypothetical protein
MVGVSAWGRFYDRIVAFPMQIDECNTAILTFEVAADVARERLPAGHFELVEFAPGVAVLVVSATDYIRNGYTPCRELTFSFPARPVGSDEIGLFMHLMPTDDALSCAVGKGTMAYPTSIELIDTTYAPDTVTFKLATGVHRTLELRIPRLTSPLPPRRKPMTVYSFRDGVPYAMPVELDVSSAVVTDLSTVGVTVGTGPVAEELRRLGMGTPVKSCTWGEGLSALLREGRPLRSARTDVADVAEVERTGTAG